MTPAVPPSPPVQISFHIDHTRDERVYTTKICCGMTVEVDFDDDGLAPTVWLRSPDGYLLFGDKLPKGALKPQVEADVLRIVAQAKSQEVRGRK